MKKKVLNRIVAICLLWVCISTPLISLAGASWFPDTLKGEHPDNCRCKVDIVAVGEPFISHEGIVNCNNPSVHEVRVWSRWFQCPSCKRYYRADVGENEHHTFPDTPVKIVKNQYIGYDREWTVDCKEMIFEPHWHYVKKIADICTYQCKCGYTKTVQENIRYNGYTHTKPKS